MTEKRIAAPEDVFGRGFWPQLDPGDLYRGRTGFKRYPRAPDIGRNERCPCGTGRKWKVCCGR